MHPCLHFASPSRNVTDFQFSNITWFLAWLSLDIPSSSLFSLSSDSVTQNSYLRKTYRLKTRGHSCFLCCNLYVSHSASLWCFFSLFSWAPYQNTVYSVNNTVISRFSTGITIWLKWCNARRRNGLSGSLKKMNCKYLYTLVHIIFTVVENDFLFGSRTLLVTGSVLLFEEKKY